VLVPVLVSTPFVATNHVAEKTGVAASPPSHAVKTRMPWKRWRMEAIKDLADMVGWAEINLSSPTQFSID
jgi:hypothetical protein